MDLFLQQILSGLANGAIYACLALAVVMIFQAIDHFNFAQGEMAMFSTYICWSMIAVGVPYWIAFFLTICVSFLAGVAIERIIFKPLHNAPVLSHIVVFIGLLPMCSGKSQVGGIPSDSAKNRPRRHFEGSWIGRSPRPGASNPRARVQ